MSWCLHEAKFVDRFAIPFRPPSLKVKLSHGFDSMLLLLENYLAL